MDLSGQLMNRLFFTTAYAEEINKGKIKKINKDAIAQGDIINFNGKQNVNSGGSATSTTINSGGTQNIIAAMN
ncbi:MAG: hypothetical protein ACRDBM_07505 [Sporomusa sp.]